MKMSMRPALSADHHEFLRYVINGVVATVVHYGVLTFNLKVAGIPSAGIANLIAAAFGITCSFLGSRYFVFRATHRPFHGQALRFATLYVLIGLVHGLVLYLWTDRLGLSYTIGFLIATAVQFTLSFVGNKKLVFAG